MPMVYIVDDDASVRDALAWLLRSRRLPSEGFASAEAFEAVTPSARGSRRTAVRPAACCWTCACPARAGWCCSTGWSSAACCR